jgi:hypothetical protein
MGSKDSDGTSKQCGIAHEMAIKRGNDEFLVLPL